MIQTPPRRLTVGDPINHAIFGRGTVLSIDQKVARVAFADERRKLVTSSLTPVRRVSSAVPISAAPAVRSLVPEPKGRHADRVGSMIARNTAHLATSSVAFTGDGPINARDLAVLLPRSTRVAFESNVAGRPADLLVIGQHRWSAEVIKTIAAASRTLRVLPQEAFLDLVIGNYDWWDDYAEWLDAVSLYHGGLQEARAVLGARWPTVVQVPSAAAPAPVELGKRSDDLEDVLGNESKLHRLGYQITGMSRTRRWKVLEQEAVPQLGLELVTRTITSHIWLRRQQKGGARTYHHAITEWKHDLNELRRTYYRGPVADEFSWPRV